jgi:hypothetical protein
MIQAMMILSESYVILTTISVSSAKKLTTLRKLSMHLSSGGTRKVEADPFSEMLRILSLAGWTKWHIELLLSY